MSARRVYGDRYAGITIEVVGRVVVCRGHGLHSGFAERIVYRSRRAARRASRTLARLYVTTGDIYPTVGDVLHCIDAWPWSGHFPWAACVIQHHDTVRLADGAEECRVCHARWRGEEIIRLPPWRDP